MKKLLLWMLLCATLVLGACGTTATRQPMHSEQALHTEPSEEASSEQSMEQPVEQSKVQQKTESDTKIASPGKQLLMIYMVGSDLESESGMASLDILEMAESGFSTENMTVLLCTGGSGYWWIEGISTDACDIYELQGDSLSFLGTMNNTNMAAPETLTEFIDYGYQNYTADYYNLILWNHGGGAVLGFGADENYNYDTLSLAEMDSAFRETSLITDGKQFEWVGFDACLMSMIEVADMLSGYANYLVASEETEAGVGWDYSCLKTISDGAHCDGKLASEEIIKAYSAFYKNNYEYIPDYTLSCLDLSQTDTVITALEDLIMVAAEELRNGGYSKIAKLRDQAKTFGKISSSSFYDTVDLYDLTQKMITLYPQQASALQAALEDMIIYEENNVHGAHGVAVYFPYENKDYLQDWLTEYASTDFSQDYLSFLKSFTDTLSGKQLAEWDIKEIAPVESSTTPGQYYVQLTPEQYANYSHARYNIWEEDSPGNYICWINSTDVIVTEDGKISAEFQGKKYFIGDSSGNSLSCCATEIERNDSYIKYAIPIIIIPGGINSGFTSQTAYIHLKVDEAHPEGVIIGVYKTLATDSTLLPDKDMIEIAEGDIISPFYFAREIVFLEDGSVSPFDEWKPASGIGSNFAVTGEFTVTLETDNAEHEYCCLFDITDTQGNSYYTNPIYIQY